MVEIISPPEPSFQRPPLNTSSSSETVVGGGDPESPYQKHDDVFEEHSNRILDDDCATIHEYPEGTLKSYLVVMGSFMGLVPCFGLLNILGVIESYVNEHQLSSVNSSTVGWIFSIFTFVTYTTCIFSGTYFDHSGARAPLITGTMLVVCGLVATASCQTLVQFIMAFSIMTSLGNGILMSPLIAVVPHYFFAKRAFFCSIATLGGSFGGILFPLMFKALFPKIGFAWSMRIFALICAVCLLFSISFARERAQFRARIHEKSTTKEKLQLYLSSFDFKSLKDLKFLFCVFGAVFAEVSAMSSITYFASYSKIRGFTIDDSYILVTMVNVGTLPGRFFTGYLADKLGRFNVFIVTILMTAVVNLVIWMPFGHSHEALYAYSVIYGVFSGSVFSLLPVCCGQVCKTSDFGKRYSTMYFVIAFGVLVGVPIGGAIIGNQSIQRYNYFIIYTAVVAFLSAGCYVTSRYYCIGRKVLIKF